MGFFDNLIDTHQQGMTVLGIAVSDVLGKTQTQPPPNTNKKPPITPPPPPPVDKKKAAADAARAANIAEAKTNIAKGQKAVETGQQLLKLAKTAKQKAIAQAAIDAGNKAISAGQAVLRASTQLMGEWLGMLRGTVLENVQLDPCSKAMQVIGSQASDLGTNAEKARSAAQAELDNLTKNAANNAAGNAAKKKQKTDAIAAANKVIAQGQKAIKTGTKTVSNGKTMLAKAKTPAQKKLANDAITAGNAAITKGNLAVAQGKALLAKAQAIVVAGDFVGKIDPLISDQGGGASLDPTDPVMTSLMATVTYQGSDAEAADNAAQAAADLLVQQWEPAGGSVNATGDVSTISTAINALNASANAATAAAATAPTPALVKLAKDAGFKAQGTANQGATLMDNWNNAKAAVNTPYQGTSARGGKAIEKTDADKKTDLNNLALCVQAFDPWLKQAAIDKLAADAATTAAGGTPPGQTSNTGTGNPTPGLNGTALLASIQPTLTSLTTAGNAAQQAGQTAVPYNQAAVTAGQAALALVAPGRALTTRPASTTALQAQLDSDVSTWNTNATNAISNANSAASAITGVNQTTPGLNGQALLVQLQPQINSLNTVGNSTMSAASSVSSTNPTMAQQATTAGQACLTLATAGQALGQRPASTTALQTQLDTDVATWNTNATNAITNANNIANSLSQNQNMFNQGGGQFGGGGGGSGGYGGDPNSSYGGSDSSDSAAPSGDDSDLAPPAGGGQYGPVDQYSDDNNDNSAVDRGQDDGSDMFADTPDSQDAPTSDDPFDAVSGLDFDEVFRESRDEDEAMTQMPVEYDFGRRGR